MDADSVFRINTPQVTYEVFEDEMVLIHFESGAYYSLNRTGAHALQLVQAGNTFASLVRSLAIRYPAAAESVAGDLDLLLAELQREQLIVIADPGGPAGSEAFACDATAAPPAAYEKPVLNRYSDMEDLIMLDPIHEVDASGWPNRKPDEAGTSL